MYPAAEGFLVQGHDRGETALGGIVLFVGFLIYLVLQELIGCPLGPRGLPRTRPTGRTTRSAPGARRRQSVHAPIPAAGACRKR